MRDLAITLIVFVGCIYTIRRPYIGILLWSWLSYMNPHRLAYGFAINMPFAQVTAIVLLGSMIFSKETQKPPINTLTIIWFIFVLFMGLTTLFAFDRDGAVEFYARIVKIQLIVFITMMLITDVKKLNQLIFVIVLSIGFYSVKGGLFTLLTGGSFRVWGPPASMIEDNNELAVASLMTIPLMAYLYKIQQISWIKKALLVTMPLSFVAAIGSQSRGALIAFAVLSIYFWLKSDKKLIIGAGMLILTIGILAFMPESWYQRMNTIESYEKDASAMGRLNAWEYAFNAANHNFLGMGLNSWSPEAFLLYAPNPLDVHAAHSIYFSVLADHGWIGLFMFLVIFYLTWKRLKWLVKNTEINIEYKQINYLAKMLQVSFIAYFTGGAFLSLSYFDLPWHLISFVVLLESFVRQSKIPNLTHKKPFN